MINTTPTVLSLCYPTTETQDKAITFVSNPVKESKLKLLILCIVDPAARVLTVWVATISYKMVAWFNRWSSVNLTGIEGTQLGWIITNSTSFRQTNGCAIYHTLSVINVYYFYTGLLDHYARFWNSYIILIQWVLNRLDSYDRSQMTSVNTLHCMGTYLIRHCAI